MTRSRLAAFGLLAVAAAALALASAGAIDRPKTAQAVSTNTSVPESTTAAPQTTTTGAAPVPAIPTMPLTGFPSNDERARNAPVVAVKIDNAPEARPQFGIEKADIIYEEKVEGGITRFFSVFQSQSSDRVGPVRSLRSTDVYIAKPIGGMIAYSGGIDPFKQMLGPNGIIDRGAETNPGFYGRAAGRPFVHSMYTSTSRLRDSAPSGISAPRPQFSYLNVGEPFEPAGAAPVRSISGQYGVLTQFDWTWDSASGLWKRGTNGRSHNVETGQLGMKNVIIQFVPYRGTPYRDRANTVVDEAVLNGTGDSWVLSDGKLVPGRWVRPDLNEPTRFNDAAGQPVKLQPGQTWVCLVPVGLPTEIRR